MSMFDDVRRTLKSVLAASRLPDGSCQTLVSADPRFREPSRGCLSSFFHGVMQSALEACPPDPELDRLKASWTGVLKQQVGPNGSVNYWLRGSPDAELHPYPDDFDSTSCVLAALATSDPASLTGDRLARLVAFLTEAEVAEGGPYRTWIVDVAAAPAWKDVDLVVNANIAYFLSTQDVHLVPLERFLAEQIEAGKYASPYYPSPFPAFYFLSRLTLPESAPKLIADIFAKRCPGGGWGSVLTTALALSALLRLGVGQEIVSEDIHWLACALVVPPSAEPFCVDSLVEGVSFFAGSPALTAVFCLEAFARYEERMETASPANVAGWRGSEEVSRLLDSFGGSLPGPLAMSFTELRNGVLNDSRGQEIPVLPTIFAQAMQKQVSKTTEGLLADLGVANVLGWIAYTVFDDFLDEEGHLPMLPVGMACLREVAHIWEVVGGACPGFFPLSKRVMNGMDAANAWEVSHCRLRKEGEGWLLPDSLPDFQRDAVLAERSLGHALGPFAVLLLEGFSEGSDAFRSTEAFFRHALIARQLDDDAHDWEEDLRRGHLNRVGTHVLRVWQERGTRRHVLRTEDFSDLCDIFWGELIVPVAEDILEHVRRAEAALFACEAIADKGLLGRVLAPMRQSAGKALAEHERTRSFLAVFKTGEAGAPNLVKDA